MDASDAQQPVGGIIAITTGDIVRLNIRRYRKSNGRTLEDLESALKLVGHPLSKLALGRIENGNRRVDVDDLTALAAVLGVNPNALILPPVRSSIWVSKLTGTGIRSTAGLWDWADGGRALWPNSDAAESPEEREALHEEQDRYFATAITPSPRPKGGAEQRIVFHGSELVSNGND